MFLSDIPGVDSLIHSHCSAAQGGKIEQRDERTIKGVKATQKSERIWGLFWVK